MAEKNRELRRSVVERLPAAFAAMGLRLIVGWALLVPAMGQLAPPNAAGVSMGHLHLNVKDLDAERRFWVALGGTPVQNGRLQLIQFPGVYVMLRQAEPKGGTEGSVIDHVGFRVKDLKESLSRWASTGIKALPGSTERLALLAAPDDVKTEIGEDPSLGTPIAIDRIAFLETSPLEVRAWYQKVFGAGGETGHLPGVNLIFSETKEAKAGTKGRSLDHIGFEVKNLEQFCKRLEAQGIKLDQPYRKLPNSTLALSFLTDPWGTYIELTEGLEPVSQ